ncbi:MAG TPA: hypothetical protein VGI93_01910 [Steroidobacteraceae bacterium]
MDSVRLPAFIVLCSISVLSLASDKWSGFLCCNLRTDGEWVTDINYQETGKHLIPAGTPVTVNGYGRYRVKVFLENKKQEIGNDYSRDLPMDEFAKRYIVSEDPTLKIRAFPQNVQDAIHQAKIMLGMSREQVLMSVGYPVLSENPHVEDKVWRFWLFSHSEFRVRFDDAGRVIKVDGDEDTVDKVLAE